MNMQTHYALNEATQYGGFWERTAAYIIDIVVVFIPLIFVSSIFHAVFVFVFYDVGVAAMEVPDSFIPMVVWLVYLEGAGWIYFAILHSSPWQASVGKKIVGLKVVDENGQRISFRHASGRYFASYISAMIFCIGFMMAGWDKKKQALHDKVAGTFVIKLGEVKR